MTMPCMSKKNRELVVVFDLDDTLYSEIDFLKSGYRAIADYLIGTYGIANDPYEYMLEWFEKKRNVFVSLNEYYNLSVPIEDYLSIYRTPKPQLFLSVNVCQVLTRLKILGCVLGIITDGRGITQRNKIKALGLNQYIESSNIIISEEFGHEKPCIENYNYFVYKYPNRRFFYIGDNSEKDFLAPNSLDWVTICLLDNGRNIHHQNFEMAVEYLPQIKVQAIHQILQYIL